MDQVQAIRSGETLVDEGYSSLELESPENKARAFRRQVDRQEAERQAAVDAVAAERAAIAAAEAAEAARVVAAAAQAAEAEAQAARDVQERIRLEEEAARLAVESAER